MATASSGGKPNAGPTVRRRPPGRPAAERGTAMILAIIFLTLFACMAVALVASADMNTTIARNRMESHQAGAMAESGLLLAEQCLSGLSVPATHDPADLHEALADHLAAFWADSQMLDAQQIDWDDDAVALPPITFWRPDGRQGTIALTLAASGGGADSPVLTIESTGRFGKSARTASVRMTVDSGAEALLRYGVTSKSHIKLSGNARIEGANSPDEASILSAMAANGRAVELAGNSVVAGDVLVTNPNASVRRTGNARIGGDTTIGADAPEWPELNLSAFEDYATNVVAKVKANETYTNIRIPAGTNPTFSGNTDIRGVVYIESPNKVTFKGNTSIVGVIVAAQPAVENLSANKITFSGNVSVAGVENLPAGAQFDGLRGKTGSFLLAPGSNVKFAGNFNGTTGAIVTGQCQFAGNAVVTLRGGLLNLCDSDLVLSGNAHLTIDKEGAGVPAGFVGGGGTLVAVRGSYAE